MLFLLFSLLSPTLALPDFSCVCETYNLNACSRAYSCRLNSSISFDDHPVPSWVTGKEEALFAATISQATSGVLRPSIFQYGRLTWESKVACDLSGQVSWAQSAQECQLEAGKTGNASRYHGWATVGFHPLGQAPGTWLTQILGEVNNTNGDPNFTNATCASSGLYVNLTYVNDTEPYDPRFSPRGFWGFLDRFHTYATGQDGVPSYKTDRDLISHGVDVNCTGYDQSGLPCNEPSCTEPPLLAHYDCPATNSGSVGAQNCWRSYSRDNASSRYGLLWGIVLSTVFLYGFLYCV